VLDRRSDGYHDLESLFQTISFGDELRIESLKERSICDVRMGALVPPERNIVYKAVDLFRSATGYDGGLRIEIKKRVPLGAGLGGGSSDAAAALKALNALAGNLLDKEKLESIALALGSDVPFFLYGGTAYISGRGEHILPVGDLPRFWVVLANPGFPSATAEAFRLLDRARETKAVGVANPLGFSRIAEALGSKPGLWPFFNDFLGAFYAEADGDVRDAYYKILRGLKAFGAEYAGLSGSGSTCFGVFGDKKDAEKAARFLADDWECVHLTFFLASPGNAVVQ
jgi:4-diphosphocytidyl-2-C-methyl-D-erythritol kinase